MTSELAELVARVPLLSERFRDEQFTLPAGPLLRCIEKIESLVLASEDEAIYRAWGELGLHIEAAVIACIGERQPSIRAEAAKICSQLAKAAAQLADGTIAWPSRSEFDNGSKIPV